MAAPPGAAGAPAEAGPSGQGDKVREMRGAAGWNGGAERWRAARARPSRSNPARPLLPSLPHQPASKLPLEVGTLVDCRWRDGAFYTARVVERRPRAPDDGASGLPPPSPASCPPDGWEYYVHYLKFNRRMDEWVSAPALDLATADAADAKRAAGHEGADDDHAEFDATALREHEEFTKVKNVERVELGRHEMETWYFSPLPPEFKDCKKLYFAEFDLAVSRDRGWGSVGWERGARADADTSPLFPHSTVFQAPRPDAPTPQENSPAAPPRRRDLPVRPGVDVRGRRQESENVLPKPVLPRQDVPGPQDALLRRRPLPLLRPVRVRRARGARGGVLFEGETFRGGLQPGLHPHPARVPAQGVRQVFDLVFVRTVQD